MVQPGCQVLRYMWPSVKVLGIKVPYLGALNGKGNSTDTQQLAKFVSEGTDVGAGGAFHRDIHVQHLPVPLGADGMHLEAVDGDRPGSELDVFAGPDAGVRTFAVDFASMAGGAPRDINSA